MRCHWLRMLRSPGTGSFVLLIAVSCAAQATPSSEDARYAQLSDKMDQVLGSLAATQQQLAESQKQVQALELRVEALEGRPGSAPAPPATMPSVSNGSPGNEQSLPGQTPPQSQEEATLHQLQESTDVLQAEVKQHDQTKVESASKYPVKISGMFLSTTNLTNGRVDNIDLPAIALPKSDSVAKGGLATSWRQTILGLDARGPSLWGAHSAADVRVDFFGGEPMGGYGGSSGAVRLRTAGVHLDWSNTELTASLDTPLISPLDPTSDVTVAEPAMSWSGNLWSWSPQIELKHSLFASTSAETGFEIGVIDPEATANYFNPALRQPSPSESAKQPGYEARVFQSIGRSDHPFTIGIGGYYDRQKYPYHEHVDAWAGTMDWKLPLTNYLELSGELYRGRGLGSLGGGAFKDYVPYENQDGVRGLDDEGGWIQLKARFASSLEGNAAIGQDSAFAGEVRNQFSGVTSTMYSSLTANRTILGNVIYRPRTYLLFSLEYRKLMTWQAVSPGNRSQIFGLAIGYLY